MAQVLQTPTSVTLKPKKLLNDVSCAVDNALEGLAMANNSLVLLENERVIMRRDHREMTGKVKLMSGGGSGHEPTSAGYVGPGMLTAAVVGDIYTAPPSHAILCTIQELGYLHPEGVLIIVQNYAGDRLNFGVAMERAHNDGIKVKMLVVGDDCALPETRKTEGRRGLAGMVLIYKIAGAMADAMISLDEIFSMCHSVTMTDLATLTIALNDPQQSAMRMENEIELGMGIHGERGILLFPLGSTAEIVYIMLEHIIKPEYETHITLNPECPIVVLINNMGGSSKLEENVFLMETLKQFTKRGYKIVRSYCGTFLTSMETSGFSITVCNLTSPDIVIYLDAPTTVTGWPRTCASDTYQKTETDEVELPICIPGRYANAKEEAMQNKLLAMGPKISAKSALSFVQILNFVSDALIVCEKQINNYDMDGGDGDCGTTLRRGAEGMKCAIKNGKINGIHPFASLLTISTVIENTMGGLTGALYSIFFAAAAKPFQKLSENYVVDAHIWLEALREGNRAVMFYGQAEVGDRSMVDALQAALDIMEEGLSANSNSQKDVLSRSAAAAQAMAENTKFMKCNVGRASMMGVRQACPDPGAYAVGIWMHAISESVKLLL